LTDGVDLRGVTTTGDAHADVDVGELVEADDEEGLVDLCGGKAGQLLVYSFHVMPVGCDGCGGGGGGHGFVP
jgi:hypothetical protein